MDRKSLIYTGFEKSFACISIAVQAFSVAALQIVANPCYRLEFWYSSLHNVSDVYLFFYLTQTVR